MPAVASINVVAGVLVVTDALTVARLTLVPADVLTVTCLPTLVGVSAIAFVHPFQLLIAFLLLLPFLPYARSLLVPIFSGIFTVRTVLSNETYIDFRTTAIGL